MVINLKVLFKNTTKYNKKVYEEYLQFHSKKYKFSYILYTATIIALFLFCLISQVAYHNFTLAITFCIFISCFFLWRFLHPIAEVRKEFNSKKIQEEKEFSFIFYEKNFKIRDKLQFEVIRYSFIRKVFETPTFFYLYIDKTHAYLLSKDSFSIGSADEFSNFIHKKCWLKF